MPNDTVTTLSELEALYAAPAATSVAKEISRINEPYRQLIDASPFLTIATIGPSGMDCSPRGDGPGFVRILDDKTLAIPDRRGNNRLDTIKNIISDSRVALLFLIPGVNETLRVNGRAIISVNPELLSSFRVSGKIPVSAIVVSIDTMYFQCARALQRSQLWNAEQHATRDSLPSTGKLIKSAMSDFDAESYDAKLKERQAKTLY